MNGPSWRFFALVLSAGLLVFSLALCLAWATDTPPATAAMWLSGCATLAAFMAAVVAARYAAAAFERERTRDEHRAQERRRAQASSVTAWADLGFEGDVRQTDKGAPEPVVVEQVLDLFQLCLTVSNNSLSPVGEFDLYVYIETIGLDGERAYRPAATHPVGRVLPGTHDLGDVCNPSLTADVKAAALKTLGESTELFQSAIGWQFRDNVGVRWKRPPGAPLIEVPEPDIGCPIDGESLVLPD